MCSGPKIIPPLAILTGNIARVEEPGESFFMFFPETLRYMLPLEGHSPKKVGAVSYHAPLEKVAGIPWFEIRNKISQLNREIHQPA